jgi:hypothetical protein
MGPCYANDCSGVCVNPIGKSGDPCNDYDVVCGTPSGACAFPSDGGNLGQCL